MNLTELADEVEVVSDLYAREHGINRDDTWYLLKLHQEMGELTQAFLMRAGQARTKGKSPEQLDSDFRDEIADVFCQILLMARHHGIDVEAEIERKWLVWSPRQVRTRAVTATRPVVRRPGRLVPDKAFWIAAWRG